MHVTEQKHLAILVALTNQHLGVVDGGVEDFGGVRPATVQVHSSQVTAVVAVYNSIDVEHWDDLEVESLPQHLSFFVIWL